LDQMWDECPQKYCNRCGLEYEGKHGLIPARYDVYEPQQMICPCDWIVKREDGYFEGYRPAEFDAAFEMVPGGRKVDYPCE
jgi:hypothetical protein